MNALLAVDPLLAKMNTERIRIRGPLAFMAEPDGEKGPDSLAIFLSQTGTSFTTVQAVEHARRHKMQTITLTADRDSPIARVSTAILTIPVGPEMVGPKTKGYTASVLTLLLMILKQAGRKLEAPRFPGEIFGLIDHCQKPCADLARAFRETDFILVMGQGRHYATALEGSLKFTEMSGIPSAAFETEEAFHGRFHGLSRNSLALFVTATPNRQEMAISGARVLSELGVGVRILNLGTEPSSPYDMKIPWARTDPLPELDLLSAIVPFQLLAWNLAKEKRITPEKMRYPGLSQKLGIKAKVNP